MTELVDEDSKPCVPANELFLNSLDDDQMNANRFCQQQFNQSVLLVWHSYVLQVM